jgi:hypothetical protein
MAARFVTAPTRYKKRTAVIVALAIIAGFAAWIVYVEGRRWTPPQLNMTAHAYVTDGHMLSEDALVRRFREMAASDNFGANVGGHVAITEVEWSTPEGSSIQDGCELNAVIFAPAGWQWLSWAGDETVGNGISDSYYHFFNDTKPAWRNPASLFTRTRSAGRLVVMAQIPDDAQAGTYQEQTYLTLFCKGLNPPSVLVPGPKLTLTVQ